MTVYSVLCNLLLTAVWLDCECQQTFWTTAFYCHHRGGLNFISKCLSSWPWHRFLLRLSLLLWLPFLWKPHHHTHTHKHKRFNSPLPLAAFWSILTLCLGFARSLFLIKSVKAVSFYLSLLLSKLILLSFLSSLLVSFFCCLCCFTTVPWQRQRRCEQKRSARMFYDQLSLIILTRSQTLVIYFCVVSLTDSHFTTNESCVLLHFCHRFVLIILKPKFNLWQRSNHSNTINPLLTYRHVSEHSRLWLIHI